MRKEDRFTIDAVNQQFSIAGYDLSYKHVKDSKNPLFKIYKITSLQHRIFKDWFIRNIIKSLKISIEKANAEFDWFELTYGLKIDDK